MESLGIGEPRPGVFPGLILRVRLPFLDPCYEADGVERKNKEL
jgi:hypothetical protein